MAAILNESVLKMKNHGHGPVVSFNELFEDL